MGQIRPLQDFLYTAEHRGERGTGSAGKAGREAAAFTGTGGTDLSEKRPAFADELYPASAGEKDEGGTGAEKQG